jgi:hypothetical protein
MKEINRCPALLLVLLAPGAGAVKPFYYSNSSYSVMKVKQLLS